MVVLCLEGETIVFGEHIVCLFCVFIVFLGSVVRLFCVSLCFESVVRLLGVAGLLTPLPTGPSVWSVV